MRTSPYCRPRLGRDGARSRREQGRGSQSSDLLEGKSVTAEAGAPGKREREAGGQGVPAEGEGQGVIKKLKRAVLNRESVRAIVQEENGLPLVGAESKMQAVVREELRALLGISDHRNTLQATLTQAFQETLTAALKQVQQKPELFASSVSGSLGPQRADWGDIAKLSAIGSTLDDVERLVKTKADSDAVRELRNIALDGKAVLDSLKFNETSRDQKLDYLRNMIASSGAGSSQGSLLQNPFGNQAWSSQFVPPSGSVGGLGPHTQSLAALAQPPLPTAPVTAPALAAAPVRRNTDDHLAVAIRAKMVEGRLLSLEGLPRTPEGIKAVLWDDLDFPAAAIDAADKFVIIKPKAGTGDTIRTCKVSFLEDSRRAGFLAVAASDHVASKLDKKKITIGEWQTKEGMLVEQSTRFSRDAAPEAKKKLDESLLALFQNPADASAIQGLHATGKAFGGTS